MSGPPPHSLVAVTAPPKSALAAIQSQEGKLSHLSLLSYHLKSLGQYLEIIQSPEMYTLQREMI